MNNLRFSLILIVIFLCDYISSVPYGSQLQKVSSASSSAATSSSAGSLTGQYGNVPLRESKVIKVSIIPIETTTTTNLDSLNQVDGGKAYGKGGQEAAQDTHFDSYGNPVTPYGELSSAKAVANVGFDYSNAGLAAAPTLQLDLLPPLSASDGKTAASTYGSNTAFLPEPTVGGGLLLPASVSVLTGGPTSLGASPHSRPTGLENGGNVAPSAGAKYGLGSYGGGAYGHQNQHSSTTSVGATPTVASYPGEKYTGGFGGPSGVLGAQKVPGYAVTENQESALSSPAYGGAQTTFVAAVPTANPGVVVVPVVQDSPPHNAGSSYGAGHSQAGATAGSYGNTYSSPQGGSVNAKPTASTSNKYTGTFGGAPGVLGNQPNQGFAVKPTAAVPVQPVQTGSYGGVQTSTQADSTGVSGNRPNTGFGVKPTGSYGGSQTTTGSYGSYGGGAKPTVGSAGNGNKYTGTFGGAPGVLGNQPNPGFAVKPAAAPVQPVQSASTGTNGGAQSSFGNQPNQGFAVKPTGTPVQPVQSDSTGTYGGSQTSFGNQPQQGFAVTPVQQNTQPSGSYGGSQTSTGSYGSYGGGAKPTVGSATNGNTYTGTFGGAPGVLGNQADPGYAVNPGSQVAPTKVTPTGVATPQQPGGSRPTVASAGNKYTGTFGGASGVLGSQQNPGFAVKSTQQTYQPTQASGSYGAGSYGQPDVTAAPAVVATQPTYRPGQSGSYGGVQQTAAQPTYGGVKPTASGAVDGQKYTGGFGGVSGVLGNQQNPGFAVKPTAPAVQPTYSTGPAVQGTQPTYQQVGGDYMVGHLTNVNAPLASPPSAALLPPASAGQYGGVTADHKIVFSDEFEPTPVYSGIYPLQPHGGQKVGGTGSYGKKPTGVTSVGGATTGGSYGSYGSYGNKQVQQAAGSGHNSGGDKPGKYTGGFGGAPGVLGEQKAPGFAVQPDGTIRDPTIAGATGVLAGASSASTAHSQPKSQAGSYNHNQAQDSVAAASSNSGGGSYGGYGSYGSGKYTAGFGGPPGVLSPYDNVTGGKYHH